MGNIGLPECDGKLLQMVQDTVSKHGRCTAVSCIAMHPKSETKSALKDKNIFFQLEMKSFGKINHHENFILCNVYLEHSFG